jgi:hypothetical protein
MYIISKRKDYYDGVAGTTGIDKTIVYDRQIIEVEENNIPEFFERKRYRFGKNDQTPFHNLFYHSLKKKLHVVYPNYAHFVVGFCGKLYMFYRNEVWFELTIMIQNIIAYNGCKYIVVLMQHITNKQM